MGGRLGENARAKKMKEGIDEASRVKMERNFVSGDLGQTFLNALFGLPPTKKNRFWKHINREEKSR